MNLPETCPFCGSGSELRNGEKWIGYTCITTIHAGQDARRLQSATCAGLERTRLIARVAELEAQCKRLEEAGDILGAAADAADDDIGQHLQVANYNLHGLLNTGDRVNPPNPPQTIHQNGIDESVMVRQKVRRARQAWRAAKEAKP